MIPSSIIYWILPILTITAMRDSGDEAEKKAKADKRLITKVRESVEKGISIKQIEDFVGQKAGRNSNRPEDENFLTLVNIKINAKESQLNSLRETRHVVYWVRNVESVEPQIVGVAWTKKNEMKLFFGIILPP